MSNYFMCLLGVRVWIPNNTNTTIPSNMSGYHKCRHAHVDKKQTNKHILSLCQFSGLRERQKFNGPFRLTNVHLVCQVSVRKCSASFQSDKGRKNTSKQKTKRNRLLKKQEQTHLTCSGLRFGLFNRRNGEEL